MDNVEDELHNIKLEVAGLKPLVVEMHSSMPRIARALETLASHSSKFEANSLDHKHIHNRLSELRTNVSDIETVQDELKQEFDILRNEHIVCITTNSITKNSRWEKIKLKAEDKALVTILTATGIFIAWVLLSHLPDYPALKAFLSGK